MRTCTGGTCSAPNYFLTDQLGSVDVVLDNAGTVLSQQRYLPFGGVRTDVPSPNVPRTDLSYTNQRALTDTGLMDYRARMYSPTLGRFIQPDSTTVPGAGNPQAYNRYSYVLNDPINLNDPTGHCGRGRGKNGCSENPFGNISGVLAGVLYSSSSLLLIPFGSGSREDDYGIRHPGGGGSSSDWWEDVRGGKPLYAPSISTDPPPNPNIYGLVAIGALLHTAIVISEIGLVWGEISLAPVVAANPLVGVPSELALVSGSLAILDIDIAYWSYTYRVYANPQVHQEFEFLPPWGLDQ